MSLNDRDTLAVLHPAVDPCDENGLIGRFYTRWFSLDVSLRDLFAPDMAGQRAAFAHALNWIYGELDDGASLSQELVVSVNGLQAG